MAPQSLHRYELIKLADKLNKDYYPLTELLCKNARVQAEWLNENNAELAPYLQLCNELSSKIAEHLGMSRGVIAGCKGDDPAMVMFSCAAFQQSRETIISILAAIRKEGAAKKFAAWEEMHDNLNMKLTVLNNLLNELFRIEDTDLIPLLEKNILVS